MPALMPFKACAASVRAHALLKWNADGLVKGAECFGVHGRRCGSQRGESHKVEEVETMHSAVPVVVAAFGDSGLDLVSYE
jgi:hypothetical protein